MISPALSPSESCDGHIQAISKDEAEQGYLSKFTCNERPWSQGVFPSATTRPYSVNALGCDKVVMLSASVLARKHLFVNGVEGQVSPGHGSGHLISVPASGLGCGVTEEQRLSC